MINFFKRSQVKARRKDLLTLRYERARYVLFVAEQSGNKKRIKDARKQLDAAWQMVLAS